MLNFLNYLPFSTSNYTLRSEIDVALDVGVGNVARRPDRPLHNFLNGTLYILDRACVLCIGCPEPFKRSMKKVQNMKDHLQK